MVGVWFALAVLAGGSGIAIACQPGHRGAAAALGGRPAGRAPRRTLIQYALMDLVERISPELASKAAALRPGQKLLGW